MRFSLPAFFLFFFALEILSGTQNQNFFKKKADSIDFGPPAGTVRYELSSAKGDESGGHNLFDSNLNTYWYSERTALAEWIIVDWGSKRLINGFEIDIPTYKNRRAIPEYSVQVLDRQNWKTIFTNTNPEFRNKHFIGNIDASILRIYFPKTEDRTYIAANLKFTLNEKDISGFEERLTGHKFPVAGGIIPEDDMSLPGAPRKYRNGFHKGIDISKKAKDGKEIFLTRQDAIGATQAGTIIRADLDYKPISKNEYDEITSYNQTHPVTFVSRDFGGRQVWIDHGNGVMTCYNHLSSIRPGIQKGTKVTKGEIIGNTGNSGLIGEATGTDERIHLHYEIWVDGEFLGKNLDPSQTKKLLQLFFSE